MTPACFRFGALSPWPSRVDSCLACRAGERVAGRTLAGRIAAGRTPAAQVLAAPTLVAQALVAPTLVAQVLVAPTLVAQALVARAQVRGASPLEEAVALATLASVVLALRRVEPARLRRVLFRPQRHQPSSVASRRLVRADMTSALARAVKPIRMPTSDAKPLLTSTCLGHYPKRRVALRGD